jgi:hypothetical protein
MGSWFGQLIGIILYSAIKPKEEEPKGCLSTLLLGIFKLLGFLLIASFYIMPIFFGIKWFFPFAGEMGASAQAFLFAFFVLLIIAYIVFLSFLLRKVWELIEELITSILEKNNP